MTHRNMTYSQFTLGNQLTSWKKDVNNYNKKRKETIQTIIREDPTKRAFSVKQHNLKKNQIKCTIQTDNKKFDEQTQGQKYRFGNVDENEWKQEMQIYEKEKNFYLKKDPQKDLLIIKESFKPINPQIPRKIKQ